VASDPATRTRSRLLNPPRHRIGRSRRERRASEFAAGRSCEPTSGQGARQATGGHTDLFGRSNRGQNKRWGTDLSGSPRCEPNGRRPARRLDLVFRLATQRRVQLNGAHAALSGQV
jgi:hypothetical protein